MPSADETWPPPTFWQGIAQFNQGAFYDCHDTLEAVWMVAPTREKPFYQGILQIAVGLYHLSNHNWRGAAILLGEGSRRLEAYESEFHRVNVSDLLDRADLWLQTLHDLGPDQVVPVAAALLPDVSNPAVQPLALEISLPCPQIQLLPTVPTEGDRPTQD
jgi:hypothetical protein